MFLNSGTIGEMSPAAAATPTGASANTSQAASDRQQINENLNRFLTLLITQLKHQDPLQPMDATQFTTQLVQFASVEQQICLNNHLEKLLAGQDAQTAASLVDYIGKMVELSGNSLSLANGEALSRYKLPEAAAETKVSIKDACGRSVIELTGETAAGSHLFRWNGRDAGGNLLPDGDYTAQISAKRRDGTVMDVATTALSRVSGVTATSDGTALIIGQQTVPVR